MKEKRHVHLFIKLFLEYRKKQRYILYFNFDRNYIIRSYRSSDDRSTTGGWCYHCHLAVAAEYHVRDTVPNHRACHGGSHHAHLAEAGACHRWCGHINCFRLYNFKNNDFFIIYFNMNEVLIILLSVLLIFVIIKLKYIKNSKIFIIGFNKTGTTSLHNFFQLNNIKSIHFDNCRLARRIKKNFNENKQLLKDYPKYIVFSDMEDYKKLNYAHVEYFKELYYQYPDSKFILNIRNIDNWIKSRNNHLNGFYAKELCKLLQIDSKQLNDKWRFDYHNHINNVIIFFKNKKNKLLIFDIEKDNINNIINFLPEYYLNSKYYFHLNKSKKNKY